MVELAGIQFLDIPPIERAIVTLNISPGTGQHTADYLALSGGTFPANLTRVLFASLVEEYRYFVREDPLPEGSLFESSPKLSRARMFPGTDTVHSQEGANAIDIADDILDFQVALGIDLDRNGVVDTLNTAGDPLSTDEDEWRFNDPADDALAAWTTSPLLHLRMSVLGRTDRPDLRYVSRPLDFIEDRVYDEGPPAADELADRRFRRRLLRASRTDSKVMGSSSLLRPKGMA